MSTTEIKVNSTFKEAEINPKLKLDGIWTYNKMENLETFLSDMNISWTKKKLALSISLLASNRMHLILSQKKNNIKQTIKAFNWEQTREYNVNDNLWYKYKTRKGHAIESTYKWGEEGKTFIGITKNSEHSITYKYIMSIPNINTLLITCYSKKGTKLLTYFTRQKSDSEMF